MTDSTDKLSYFQAITGVEDIDLCTEILSAHNWDLEQAISTFTSTSSTVKNDNNTPATTSAASSATATGNNTPIDTFQPPETVNNGNGTSLVWNIITLPITIVSSSLGLVSSAIGLGFWIAGGVLSYTLGVLGFGSSVSPRISSSSANSAGAEAVEFVEMFEREFGNRHVNFVGEGFMEVLQRSRREFKLMFVYLHSPEHPDTERFCVETLCSEVLSEFVNENFVAWGGSVRGVEGFKMGNSLKASRFPFCAVVMAATNQRIALLQQIEGPKSPEEMLTSLQRVLEESSTVLVAARLEAEERMNNIRLREEQDAAYQAALEADQARERQRREEEERLAREAAEAERKQKEEEEARAKAAREAAEREAALVKLREEKGLSLGPEPEKGPDVSQVLVRLPNGDRKGRRFYCTATIQSLYDFVDSSSSLEIGNYTLATNFPRVLYGPDKLSLTLKEAGLHPQSCKTISVSLQTLSTH
ncbi:putative UBX domain, UBA-like superfamily, Ubiquitin-like domain superfamily [Helianthus annuus]|nr:putative UBX domain, UBA-like superfamily, Ubiquitin-like domain superfamily [Helianthus annuus]